MNRSTMPVAHDCHSNNNNSWVDRSSGNTHIMNVSICEYSKPSCQNWASAFTDKILSGCPIRIRMNLFALFQTRHKHRDDSFWDPSLLLWNLQCFRAEEGMLPSGTCHTSVLPPACYFIMRTLQLVTRTPQLPLPYPPTFGFSDLNFACSLQIAIAGLPLLCAREPGHPPHWRQDAQQAQPTPLTIRGVSMLQACTDAYDKLGLDQSPLNLGNFYRCS